MGSPNRTRGDALTDHRSRTIAVLLAALAGLCGAGCLSRPVCVASATHPLTPGRYTEREPVSASVWGFSFLHVFSFGSSDPAGLARDRALQASGAQALIDVTIQQNDISLFFIVSLHVTELEGTAVQIADTGLAGP